MPGATVRISENSRDLLRELSRRTDSTMQDVIAKALDAYQKRLFWAQAEQEFRAMREDKDAWDAELAEREAWDTTLNDGLDSENAP